MHGYKNCHYCDAGDNSFHNAPHQLSDGFHSKKVVKKPVEEHLKTQGRFRHLFKPENKHVIDEIQKEVDRRWQKLLKLYGIS